MGELSPREFFGEWAEVIDFNILNQTLSILGRIIQEKEISPSPSDLFKAFTFCPYNKLSVIMVGLDPYPQKNTATGIAFGNKEDTPLSQFSPSLKILYDAVWKYCSYDLPFSTIDKVFPTLEQWCNQGVLMLNSALSVEIGKVRSHTALWRPFIKNLLTNCQKKKDGLIFVLLGEVAQTFKSCLNPKNVVSCVHPSKCARTGEEFPDIFKEIDDKMIKNNKQLIYWI